MHLPRFWAAALFLCATGAFAEAPWTPIRTAEGVRLGGRPAPPGPYWEYQAETEVGAPVETLVAYLQEARTVPCWLAYVLGPAETPVGPGEPTARVVFDLPWPYADAAVEFRLGPPQRTDNGWTLFLTGRPEPRAPASVVAGFEGSFWITPGPGGSVVRFRLHTVLTPEVPAWAANGALGDLPFRSLVQLRGRFAP